MASVKRVSSAIAGVESKRFRIYVHDCKAPRESFTPTIIATTSNLTMPTGDGAHNVENIAGQACLNGQGGTEPVSVVSVPAILI